MKLLVELNGEEKEVEVGSYLKVIYEDYEYDAIGRDDATGQLHLTLTDEGLVVDLINDSEVAQTGCLDLDGVRGLTR